MNGLKRRLKPIHDRVFRNHVYFVQFGFLAGFYRRGRMAWFQRPNPDPRYQAELDYFRRLDLDGQVVFDIGANLGTHALFMARRAGPAGRVVAFEPDPVMADGLEDTIALNRMTTVDVYRVAVGSTPARLRLAVPDSSRVQMSATLSASLQTKLTDDLVTREVEVKVVRLDDYVPAHDLPDPQFVKIDVEGFEVEVLRGARALLARAHPRLFVEMHGADADEKRRLMREALTLLTELGYTVTHFETKRTLTAEVPDLPLGGHLIAEASG